METNTLFWGLSYNEWTLISSIVTAVTAIVSIVISVVTLKKNNKMIEESTRPSIQIFYEPKDSLGYIVIKNYGASPAFIDYITCNHHFTLEQIFIKKLVGNPFSILNKTTICTNQSLFFPVNIESLTNESIEFQIKYRSATKTYREQFEIHPHKHSEFPKISPSKVHGVDENLNLIAQELRKINDKH